MAIIVSMGVGRAKKSMGNVTYRSVRGRTIGSQKRVSGTTGALTRGLGGNVRKPLFAMINMFMAAHKTDIEVSFNKSKYGSQRNYFMTKNYDDLSAALMQLAISSASSGELPSITDIETAISTYATANPDKIYRVRLDGFETIYLSGPWSPDDNPVSGGATDGLGIGKSSTTVGSKSATAPIAISMNYHAGAKIVHDGATVSMIASALPSGIADADIQYLTANNTPVEGITVSDVTSATGSLSFTTTAITAAQNVIALKVGAVYVRLTSAYVTQSSGLDENPLG